MAFIGTESVDDGFVIKFTDSGDPIMAVRFEEGALPTGAQKALVAGIQKAVLRELRKMWNSD